MRFSQILMSECLSNRQAAHTKGVKIRKVNDQSLHVGLGLTLHQQIGSKGVVDFVSRLGVSVNYDRIRAIETSMASSVIKQMLATSGVYVLQTCSKKNASFIL